MPVTNEEPAVAFLEGPLHLYRQVNAAFARLVGGRDVLGQPLAEALPDVKGARFDVPAGRAVASGKAIVVREVEVELEHETRFLDFVWMPQGGGVLVSGVDVTDRVIARRRSEALGRDLTESEERLRRVVEASGAGLWSIEVATGAMEVDANMVTLMGLPPGASFDLTQGLGTLPFPEDAARVDRAVQGAIAGVNGGRYLVEFRTGGKDAVPLRWVESRAKTTFGPDGQATHLSGVMIDVTARRSAEDELRTKSERLNFALRAGQMGTWDLDLRTGELTSSETCKANYGFGADEPFPYETLAATVLDEDRTMWAKRVASTVERGTDLDVEYRVRWPDGSVHWVHVRASVAIKDGAVVALSGVSSRIDARKAIEAELVAADRRKDEFLTTASHELRTPLNAILGWATMLQTGKLDAEGMQRAVTTIERNGRAQVKLIEDILDGSRMISGKLRLEISSVDMTELVRAAVDVLRPAADAKKITLSVVLDAGAARILGDPDRLQQVIWNLASNAIKFTPRGGHVELRLERSGTYLRLRVRDDGQGIAEDFLPYVFERFRQADGSTTRRHGGLGLGLALVEHLVTAHGGTVSAASEGPGRGATFDVLLPVQAVLTTVAAPIAPPPPSQGRQGTASLAGVTALVVDDEADARDLVAAVLRMSGAAVELADSVGVALEALERRAFSVLVSDIGMPGRDGYAFARALRASDDPRLRELPAVALTAYARAEDRRLSLEAGFQRFVTKPVEPEVLVETVASLVFPSS